MDCILIYNTKCQDSAGLCVGPGQLCDGVADCGGGEDEAAAVCRQHECGHGVRCGEGDTCLYTPHTQLCTGGDFHNTTFTLLEPV